ncbi:MAG: LacI family DNA-binding transcriptional regulator [Pseudomonadota bacterium]
MPPSRSDHHTPSKRVTLKDVAEAADVSVMTVSNVLHNKANVSPQTRKKVKKEIARLGYVPAQAARSLRASKQWSIGFLIVDQTKTYMADYTVAEWTASISARLNSYGYSLLLHAGTPEDIAETTILQRFSVDGIILHVSGDETKRRQIINLVKTLGVPIVLVQASTDDVSGDCVHVQQADFDGARQIADHLAARGAREILVVITQARWAAFEERYNGLKHGVKSLRSGIKVSVLRTASESPHDVQHAVERHILKSGLPDAIAGGNDAVAAAAMKKVRDLGHSVPKDVLVTGFNGVPIAELTSPTLTTVVASGQPLGEVAVETLINRLETGRFEHDDVTIPMTLRMGHST